MSSDKLDLAEAATADTDDLFEMANLFPRTTGLPMTVWVGPRGNARHDVRIKANMAHGNQMTVENTAVIGVRPSPHLIAGHLSAEDQRAVFDWVMLNSAAILTGLDGDIDTVQLARMMQPLPWGP